MKKYVGEFKVFINRGNVVDMAVGVIVGSAFTAIVTALTKSILQPLIDYVLSVLFREDSRIDVLTFLKRVTDTEGNVDLTQSIYIDWGSFLSAVFQFLIVAFVLFSIAKIVSKLRSEHRELTEQIAKNTLDHSERSELRDAGVNIRDKKAVAVYYETKKRFEEEDAASAAIEAEEKARLERLANPTTEDLLKQILAQMKSHS